MNHEYKGSFIVCLICGKGKQAHLQESTQTIQELVKSDIELMALESKQAEILLDLHQAPIVQIAPIDPQAPKACQGHTCPSCDETWYHEGECKRPKSKGYCLDCAQQDAALINRPRHIEELAHKSSDVEQVRKAKELEIQTEEFVVLHLIHNSDGSEREDWQDRVAAFIRTKEESILLCRREISGAHRARANKEVQDLNKLSDEERELYKKQGSRSLKANTPRVKKEKDPLDRDIAISQMAKMIRSMNPKLSQAACMVKAVAAVDAAKENI